MAKYTRKFFELDQLSIVKEKRHVAQEGDILTGDPYDANCLCEHRAMHTGRPVMLEKIVECDYCKAKNLILQAESQKQQMIMQINQRLNAIDQEAGPRATREELIALGRKGFRNKIETLENEAISLRAELATLK